MLSRRRYEVLALAVSLAGVGLHLWSDASPAVSQKGTGEATSRVSAVARAVHLIEGRAVDIKFRLRGAATPDPAVVVVEIDEKATQKYGLFPWPRTRVAAALDHLLDADARVIGLDIAFTDEANDDGQIYRALLSKFDEARAKGAAPDALADFRSELQQRTTESPDGALEAAFRKGAGRIVQGVLTYKATDLKDIPPAKVDEHARLAAPWVIQAEGSVAGSTLPAEKVKAWKAYALQTPLERFATHGNRLGHFSYEPDVDGTIRRTPILIRLERPPGFIPSLALATAAVQLDAALVPVTEEGLLTGVRLEPKGKPPFFAPYQGNEPFMLINHIGPPSAFPRLSIADVIEGTFDKAQVAGKAVLIGVTTVGSSGDQRVTPFSEFSPGVYSHASVVSNFLDRAFLSRPPWLVLVEALLMLALGFTLARLIPRVQSFGLKAAIIVGVALAWLVVSEMLFARGTQMAVVMPVVTLLGTSFGLIFLGYLSVDREKLQLRATFSKYLGEDVMEEALRFPDKLNQGEKREMSVLFSDIRGFTTLSERMVPEKLAAFMKDYLSPMTKIVFDEKGTLDKYIGDAVMAFWNAPLDQNDHALRAVRAGWLMLKKLEELKARWRAENFPEFDIGVGINSGPMIVGNIGSDVRVDYTVMGDAVNLASRLEGTNKDYETRIIISEGTWNHVKDQVVCRRLGSVRVKGKRKPVRIYEVRGLGTAEPAQAAVIATFDDALDAYAEQRWDDAEKGFTEVLKHWADDPPARRYLEELVHLRQSPPGPGWDGVYTATTK